MHTPKLLVPTLLAAALLGLAAGCSTVPDRNYALEQAHNHYNLASGNPQVTSLAPEELKRAGDSMRSADKAWREHESSAQVDHLAYMTRQRITIAQDTAASRADEAITAKAGAERDHMRLNQRSQEVDQAQQQLAVAQQSNAQKSLELASADAAAQQSMARAERRNARLRDLELQLQELNAKKTERGMVLTLGDVLFDSGQSQLLPDSSRNLNKLADFFKRNPSNKASIEGYTDSIGSASSNLSLSERRAHAVMAALVNLGVPADHLSSKAHGEDMPVASNDTAAGRQLNRRVEIIFAPQTEEVSLR